MALTNLYLALKTDSLLCWEQDLVPHPKAIMSEVLIWIHTAHWVIFAA
jgi:hypothetical protein